MTRSRLLAGEQWWLALAFLLIEIHGVDDAFLNAGRDALPPLGVLVSIVVAGVLVAVWPSLAPRIRMAVSGLLGLAGLAASWANHLVHFVIGDAKGSDYSGVIGAVGTAVLLVIAVLLVVRRRELESGVSPPQ